MKLTPHAWQLKDLAKLRAHNYTGLIGIEAGGGKSLLATLAVKEAKPRVTLIIAPQSTHESAWIPTLRDNADVQARIIGNKLKANREALFDFEMGYPGVYITTPQFATRADSSAWRGDMLIHDESHMGSTPKSKLQRVLGGYSSSDGRPLSHRFTHRLALSGTPMRSDFSNLWGTMRFLWPELEGRGQVAHRNFYIWQADRMEYETVYTSQRNPDGSPKQVKQYLSEKQPGRLLAEAPCVIIHKRRERCCDDLMHANGFLSTKEPQVIKRIYQLTTKQRRAIRDMNAMMMSWIEGNPLVAEIPLTQKQRIRQFTLAEATVEYVERDGEEKSTVRYEADCVSPVADETIHILSNLPAGEPVVIFGESQRFVEVLTEKLNRAGFAASEYSGVKKADLNEFGKSYQVLVGVLSAIGTGTDGLQAKCNTEIWAEQPISMTNEVQAKARLDRMGGRQVQSYVLLDDEGVQEGRMEDLWLQKLVVSRSMVVR